MAIRINWMGGRGLLVNVTIGIHLQLETPPTPSSATKVGPLNKIFFEESMGDRVISTVFFFS